MFFESFFLNVIVLLVLIVALLFDYITKFFSYWYVRHIPYKTPIPCFGSDFERVIGLRGTTDVVRNLYSKYPKDNYVGYVKGRIPDLIVRDPKVIKLILSTDFAHFNNKGLCLDKSRDICMKNNLFYAEGEKWTLLREQIGAALKDATSWKFVFDKITEQRIGQRPDKLNINEAVGDIMDSVLVKCVIGTDTADDFVSKLRRSLQNPNMKNQLTDYVKTIFPSVYNFFGIKTLSTNLIKQGCNFLNNLPGNQKSIFNDKLLELNMEYKKGNTDTDLSFLCSIITEAYTPCFNIIISILYEVAKNNDVQNKTREAIKFLQESNNKKADNSENDYLNNVIKEALRLYPVYSIINRKCMKPFKIPDGDADIDKGVTVTIPVEAILKDCEYYPEPHIFDPNRFHKEAQEKRHPYAYIPFGAGPRKCPGAELAHNIIGAIVSAILMHYQLEPCAETPEKLAYKDYDFKRLLSQDVWLKLTPLR